MSIRTDLEKLTELELLELADKYHGAGHYLRDNNIPNKGQYTSIINKLMVYYNIEWLPKGSKYKEITKICPICKKSFTTKNDKDEKTTCGYSCANTYFRSGKNNGSYVCGNHTNYRLHAFIEYGKECNRCNIADEDVLVVHHKDRNRKNNDISNLEVLCSNCHMKEHRV